MTKETIEAIVGYSITGFLEDKNELSFELEHPSSVITLQQLNTLARSWRATEIEVSTAARTDGTGSSIYVIATR